VKREIIFQIISRRWISPAADEFRKSFFWVYNWKFVSIFTCVIWNMGKVLVLCHEKWKKNRGFSRFIPEKHDLRKKNPPVTRCCKTNFYHACSFPYRNAAIQILGFKSNFHLCSISHARFSTIWRKFYQRIWFLS
jgi:hypothetical protein